ncbi:MAG: hypothetical protein U9N51_01950 [Bacteroidota bacterium]|nr:hypothetical protein [Bacteroidota bacterium]
MENKTNILLVWFQRIKTIKINRNSLIFGLFLLISSILWVLNALNKDYVERLKYQVVFTNMPENTQIQNQLPNHLFFEVRGHGYDILGYKINYAKTPIQIDLNKVPLRKKAEGVYFLLSNELIEIAKNRIKGDVTLNRILPDSIYLITEPAETRKVPVKSIIKYTAAKQHMITSEPKIIPDSVEIQGIPGKLAHIDHVVTENKSFLNMTSDLNRFIKIKSIPGISLEPDRVQISIGVKAYTEANLKVPIKIINLPANHTATSIPGNANITMQVAMNEFKTITPDKFTLQADFETIKQGKTKIIITQKPNFTRNIEISPKEVQIILKKNILQK